VKKGCWATAVTQPASAHKNIETPYLLY
jgi:hypothetical protein